MVKNKIARKGLAKVTDYQTVFNNPVGKNVLMDLMSTHSMMSSTYRGDSVKDMLIKEGERNVVLRILTILKANTKQLLERIEEHEKDVE